MEKIKNFISILYSVPQTLSAVLHNAYLHIMWWIFNVWSFISHLKSHAKFCLSYSSPSSQLMSMCVGIDEYMCVSLRFFSEKTEFPSTPHQIFHFNLVWFLPFVAVGVSHFLYMFETFELWTKAIFDFLCILQGFSDGISIWARKLSRKVIKQLW